MRIIKALVLLLLMATVIAADSGRNRRRGHFRGHRTLYVRAVPAGPYFATLHDGPDWEDNYPIQPSPIETGDLQFVHAEQVFTQIEKLGALAQQGLLTAKEFSKVKKRLLGRIGKYVPATDSAADAAEAIGQLKMLRRLKVKGLLNEVEYADLKKKLLALI